jgi:hypothetical protein
MLSMKLALKMIRKAKNMCFRDVLNMELKPWENSDPSKVYG